MLCCYLLSRHQMKRRELLFTVMRKSCLFIYRREARVQHWMRLELQELFSSLSAPQLPCAR